jgi:hypothetical protein
MLVAEKFDAALVQTACDQAVLAAKKAAYEFYQQHGDRDACGFAWVTVYGVRSNSRLGKTLATYGFSKSYNGGLQLWNPSKAGVQSISILEAGAEAYAEVLREQLGLEAYAGSRLD